MDLSLIRKLRGADGIFSDLLTSNGALVFYTLEHAYLAADGISHGWIPKIPPGTYTCVRSMHRLHDMVEDFETFEITGVKGHTNILFHCGNYNKDSDGCVLVGSEIIESVGSKMLIHSREAFKRFMDMQTGLNQFNLTVGG